MRNIVELNTSFELANPVKDDVTIKDQAKFKQMVEICSALFTGTDAGKYGTQKDAVATVSYTHLTLPTTSRV